MIWPCFACLFVHLSMLFVFLSAHMYVYNLPLTLSSPPTSALNVCIVLRFRFSGLTNWPCVNMIPYCVDVRWHVAVQDGCVHIFHVLPTGMWCIYTSLMWIGPHAAALFLFFIWARMLTLVFMCRCVCACIHLSLANLYLQFVFITGTLLLYW